MKYLFLIMLCSTSALSQTVVTSKTDATATMDGIVAEVLNIVSGPKGKVRDWDAFRTLFLENATFSVLYHDDSLTLPVETVSVDEFIEYMDEPYYEEGFEEYEISKVVNEYNGIASVFQTYQGRDSEGYEETGINSYQLVYFKNRWWIANMLWTGDGNGVEVPEKYLKN